MTLGNTRIIDLKEAKLNISENTLVLRGEIAQEGDMRRKEPIATSAGGVTVGDLY